MTDELQSGDDPGWAPALKGLLFSLLPGTVVLRTRRHVADGGSSLLLLRSLLMTFVGATVAIGVMVAVLDTYADIGGNVNDGLFAAGMVLVAAVSVVGGEILGRARSLDCTSPETLVRTYVPRFFLRVAVSEAAAMLGFVAFVLSGNPMMYVIGAGAAGLGFCRLAPTRARLVEESDRLQLAGCRHRLEAALARPHG